MPRWVVASLAIAALAGCEYFVSDVATRVRYSLADAKAELLRSSKDTLTITLRPNHAPDACPGGAGYRVTLKPYKGNKQVAVGDIVVQCQGRQVYYTGFGSEDLYVTRELSADKKADDEVRITLRKARAGVEIVALE